MKTKCLLFLVAAMLATTAMADSHEGVLVVGQPDNKMFLDACQAGYARDLCHLPKAQELGFGQCDLISSGKEAKYHGCADGDGKCDPPRKPLASLVKEAKKNCTRQRQFTAWYAWIDDQGVVNMVFNTPMRTYEQSLIWQVASTCRQESKDWQAWNIYFVCDSGGNTWIQTDKARFSWLKLGHADNEKSATETLTTAKQVLTDLHLAEFAE